MPVTEKAIRVSATVTMTRLVAHPQLARLFPALVEAAVEVGSRQIRNRATPAGNICNASPADDTVPVLTLRHASVCIHGPDGERVVTVVDFVQGNRKIDLAPGELVTTVLLPVPQGPQGAAFDRITRRRGVDLATVNLCCRIDVAGRLWLAIGAAAPRPLVVDDAVGFWSGAETQADAAEAHDTILQVATPIRDVRATAGYRMGMLKVRAERTRTPAQHWFEQGASMTDVFGITLTVNGRDHSATIAPTLTLLDVLRDDLKLKVAKECCGVGECGACTVMVDGETVNSCLTSAVEANARGAFMQSLPLRRLQPDVCCHAKGRGRGRRPSWP